MIILKYFQETCLRYFENYLEIILYAVYVQHILKIYSGKYFLYDH